MLHPSYSELMKVVNSDVEEGEAPVVNSRYSIVLATAKRARQIIDRQSGGDLDVPVISKPLSKAVDELYKGEIKIVPEQEEPETEETAAEETAEETASEEITAEAETEEA